MSKQKQKQLNKKNAVSSDLPSVRSLNIRLVDWAKKWTKEMYLLFTEFVRMHCC